MSASTRMLLVIAPAIVAANAARLLMPDGWSPLSRWTVIAVVIAIVVLAVDRVLPKPPIHP